MLSAVLALSVAATPLARRAADPGWYEGEIFYQVYVRSFRDSDGDGNGDLRGLIEKLDDVAALGVTGLWLMPIYEGPSEHGYAVANYDQVERDYGSMEDIRRLFEEAHRRDLAVILDYVPNHLSREHAWFRGKEAKRRFIWRDREPKGWSLAWNPQNAGNVWSKDEARGRWYYHAFTPDMPDVNLRDPKTREEILDVTDRWLARGADGFRVDAIRYLYEDGAKKQADRSDTFRFVADLRKRLDAKNAMMVVEAWADTETAARYAKAGAHLAFDFGRAYGLKKALESGEAGPLSSAVRKAEASGAHWAVFVTNHDNPTPRAASFGRDAAVLANALVLLSGGVPFLWQGDELALRGISEHQTRRPYRWTSGVKAGFTTGKPWREIGGRDPGDNLADQKDDPESPWRRTQALIALRKKSTALTRGTRRPVKVAGSGAIWAFLRTHEKERVLIAANLSEEPARGRLSLRGAWEKVHGNGTLKGTSVSLPGRGFLVARPRRRSE